MTNEDLEKLKSILLEDKKRIEEEIESLKDTDYGDDVDSFDEESDEAEQMAINSPISGTLKTRLRGIKKALEKIENGTYGKCEDCDKEIPQARREAKPESVVCIDCKADE